MGWEETFLKELGREKSESYRSLYTALGWFLTVTLAIITIAARDIAILQPESQLSTFWLLAMVSIVIVTSRYYSRAMMDYVNMQVWSKLFNKCALMLLTPDRDQKMQLEQFKKLYITYVCDWQSIIKRRKVIRDTLDIGYGHLIFFELCLLDLTVYKMAKSGCYVAIFLSLSLMAAFVGYEVYGLFTYRRFKYVDEAKLFEDNNEERSA